MRALSVVRRHRDPSCSQGDITFARPKSWHLLAATTALLHYCLCGPSVRPLVTSAIHQNNAREMSTAIVC